MKYVIGERLTFVLVEDVNGASSGTEVAATVIPAPTGSLEDLVAVGRVLPDDTANDPQGGVWVLFELLDVRVQFFEQPDGTLMWCTYGGGFEKYSIKEKENVVR